MEHLKQTIHHQPDEGKILDLRKELKVYSDRYIPYLRNMISLGSTDTEWVNTARDYPELLNFFRPEPSLYDFYGTTDVAVVQRSAVRARQPEKGLLVLFDISRDISEVDHAKAMMRVLVANLKSPETRPIVVKTDLQKQWYVLWMDGNTVRRQNLQHNGAAVHVVELALGVRQTTREGEKAFVNRQRTPDNNIPQPRNVKCEVTHGGRRISVEDI
ncbi:g8702 [Coccomyxa viridis]|uniref:G8702 protein n=1 Tax=Coccomyxa viridis TaxID=1274662 RepID=A0ABP1G561_9CHLO